VEIRRSLSADLREVEAAILRLTDQQRRVVDMWRGLKRVAVGGGAGTGKTVLALEKARRLADEGFAVLVSCYNLALAEELRREVAGWEHRPEVLAFHELCEQLAMEAGLLAGRPEHPGQEYWDTRLPDLLLEALDALPERRFDAVVVDEGQDLRDHWWTPLQCVLASPEDGVLYVFHDENQVVFGQDSALPKDLVPLSLTVNLRNTAEVFAVVRPLCPDPGYTGDGPEGLGVEYHEIDGPQGMQAELSRVLHRLIHERKLKLADLAVITGRSMLPRANSPSELRDLAKVGQFRLSHPWPGSEGAVLVEVGATVQGAGEAGDRAGGVRGLLDHQDLLYVAASRARSLLVIIGTAEVCCRLQP